MTMRSDRFGFAVLFSLAAVVGCGGSEKGAKSPADSASSGESGGSGHAEVGKAAPDLSIQSLNGKGKISLESLQGKVVVVDFWATWCGPCKQSFPKLDELSKKVGDKVVIVGISVDDDKRGVADFAKENGATFAIGWDEGHVIAEKWKVGTMPTTFIVDATGKVRHIHDGYHDGETKVMEKELAVLVEEGTSGTRVAKNEDAKSEAKEDTKTEKSEAKSDAKEEKVASSTPDAEETTEAAPPPKKKGGKKGGKGGGKAAGKKPKKK